LGRKIIYRFEVWVAKTVKLEDREKLKLLLTETFGSTVDDKPINA
jgi:hypothetical protein